jgi:CheY-like chemotaxis protein
MIRLFDRLAGGSAFAGWWETMARGSERQRILVIGRSTPLIEGVSDLLQVVGYPVDMSSTWAATEYAMGDAPSDLVIVDLSLSAPDGYRLAEQIRNAPEWNSVPILFVSFSGDDSIRELQQQNQGNGDAKLHFYAHTLLGMDGLLDKVRTCFA